LVGVVGVLFNAARRRCSRLANIIRNGIAIGNNATDKIDFAAFGT